MADLENISIDRATPAARIVINARTGSVVMNQAVMLENCAISHGNLTVTVGADPARAGAVGADAAGVGGGGGVWLVAAIDPAINKAPSRRRGDIVLMLSLNGGTRHRRGHHRQAAAWRRAVTRA